MTVALSKEVESFIEDQVRTGACTDATTLVNDVLRSLVENHRLPISPSPELESWLLEAADGDAAPLFSADFEGIRARVGARLGQRSA